MRDSLRESSGTPEYYQRQALARLPLLRQFLVLTAVLTLAFCGWDRVVDQWAWLPNLIYRGLGCAALLGLATLIPKRLSALNFDRWVIAFALLYSLYLIFLLAQLHQGLTLGMPCLSVFLTLCCFLLVHSRHAAGLVLVLMAVTGASVWCGLDRLVLWSQLIILAMSLGCGCLLARVFEFTARGQFELEGQLSREARSDSLTGLLNRRALEEVLTEEIERANRYGRPVGILLWDIDRFKKVNDTLGHDVGDEVLRQVARTCSECLRSTDRVGRWGGEEFLVVLPETPPAEALALAERLRQTLMECESFTLGHSVRVTVSIGVTSWIGGDTWEVTYSRVDTALYEAKRSGRNRCVQL